MIISFYSNYLTHHQVPFCNAMMKQDNVEFHFISTIPMDSERISGGWALNSNYSYELRAYQSPECEVEAMRLACVSDVIIIGSAPDHYVTERMKNGSSKLTFRYSERIYKGGYWRAISPRGMLNRIKTYFRYISKPLYMLCASAYTAGDLAILGSYIGRCYKWGYFPEVKQYENIESIVNCKISNSILWVARLIEWKHPEVPIRIAKKLKDLGYRFQLNMIGNGEKEETLKTMIVEYKLQDYVHLIGSISPAEVRTHMEQSQIFLFTSDRNEGWGAVLNEAMNSACAVVASNAIGSVPFLIKNGINGYMYQDSNEDALFACVKYLLDNPAKCKEVGKAAYKAMTDMWNADVAAERFVNICSSLLAENKKFYDDGVCSKAPIIIGKVKTNAHINYI